MCFEGLTLAFSSERVLGFFFAGGIRKGWVVYVTTNRIRVNWRRIKPLAKTHMFAALVALLGLATPQYEPWLLILTVVIVIAARLYERTTSRRKWPSVGQVQMGQRRFEVEKGELLSIEMKPPQRLHRGYAKITPLTGDSVVLSIARNKNFAAARNIFDLFDSTRVTIAD